MNRRRMLLVGVVLLVLAVVAAGLVAWRTLRDDDSRIAAAMELAPASALRFSWTDWAAVRRELGATVSASSTPEDVEDFLLDAFDRDLSSMTALEESAPTIQRSFGFSPASIDWELFAQGEDGAAVLMGLPPSYDVEGLRSRLRAVGYREPSEPDGVWEGGANLLENLNGPVTPELAALQIDEDRHLLVGSDTPEFLASLADHRRGAASDGVSSVVSAIGDAVTASVLAGDQACSELAMSQADQADVARATELVRQAGGVHPLTGFAMAGLPGGAARAAFAFENHDQARADADARSRLAAGPAPGQGGTFPERFTLGEVVARDRVVTMELAPVEDSPVVSDLSSGPVLFATC